MILPNSTRCRCFAWHELVHAASVAIDDDFGSPSRTEIERVWDSVTVQVYLQAQIQWRVGALPMALVQSVEASSTSTAS